MGQTPSKFFPAPTPYGQSPDMGVLAQAKAASPAPLQNFLPLNPPDPSQQQQPTQQPQAQPMQNGYQAKLARLGFGGYQRMNRDMLL